MKTRSISGDAARPGRPVKERGMALVLVLVVMTLMAAFLAASGMTVANLRRELRLVEQRQLQRYGTNAVTPIRIAAPAPVSAASPP